ncbi:DUF6644 family protein [Pseudohongiella spirulinae]|uniref:DUF6644 domain-containing protein n=1 Tax=Pseudohongiella spirulinae TaxID=1249552 RepID=A0A0S2KDE3_9GAMM|nr:DUF6644 family protein [Pseudohongiella spirulinae]ALO46265.1 hypothetical protein PS2015_1612 [Pseudohongiella spirulinae]
MNSSLREFSTEMLRSIPGLPPILQTIHLLGLVMLMASVVMICLRVLNIAARRQQLQELGLRLQPWFYWSLPVMLFSALPFFLARPQRYIYNPIFAIKLVALLVALLASISLLRHLRRLSSEAPGITARLMAVCALLSWLLTALAGRWIAYVDYIFWAG